MAISDWADDMTRWVEAAQDRVGGLFEPTLRIGVTGLARAGKTVLITSAIANLLRRGRMLGLTAEGEGRILAAHLSPQPDLDAPRFEYEAHLGDLYADPPRWPDSTRSVAQLRLSLRYQSAQRFGGGFGAALGSAFGGDAVLHLDIVDYPGEWLLDLPLMGKSFADWSAETLTTLAARADTIPAAGRALDWARSLARDAPFDEAAAQTGAALFTAYLQAARDQGLAGLAPGRFLLPGDLAGAPAVTFAPIPDAGGRDASAQELSRRYEGYKRIAVRPFFRDHFARLDRQIVLVDALGAVSRGPSAVEDLGAALREILACFRPGENSWLRTLLGPAVAGRRIDRLLLAVSKADHIHSSAHPALNALVRDLLARSIDHAAFRGAAVSAMAIAGVRATTETEIMQPGLLQTSAPLPAVAGRLASSGETAKLFAGEPPSSLAEIARGDFTAQDIDIRHFAPPRLEHRENEGPPHLRLDQALEFLIGDKLA